MLTSFDLHEREKFETSDFWPIFLQKQSAVMAIAGDALRKSFKDFIGFDEKEMQMLINLSPKSRCFVLKQYGFSISAKVNLNEFSSFVRILSSSNEDIELYRKMKNNLSGQELLSALYKAFDS